jgi:uncharacterized protein with HEPN domain
MTPEIANRLRDVQQACADINRNIQGMDVEDLLRDRDRQLTLQMLLIIVGEALGQARKLDPEIGSCIANVHRFIAVRNQVVHGYESVDYSIVWTIVTKRIPTLLADVSKALASDGPQVSE